MMEKLDKVLSLKSLGGDHAALYDSVAAGKNCYAFALDRGSKIHIASSLDRFVLYVASDRTAARTIADKMGEYLGDGAVGVMAEKDDILIHRQAYQQQNTTTRLVALRDLICGRLKALVVSAECLLQYLPDKESFRNSIIRLEKGREYPFYDLVGRLAALGYAREEVTEQKGTFSVKGDIVSVFPHDYETPVRISFFDTEIESIKTFDPDTMMSVKTLDSCEILPVSDMLFPSSALDGYRKTIDKLVSSANSVARERTREIVEDINSKLYGSYVPSSLVWLLPFVCRSMSNITDYIPADAVVVYDESKTIDGKLTMYASEHYNRVQALAKEGEALKLHVSALISKEKLYGYLSAYTQVSFEQMTSVNPIFRAEEAYSFKVSPLPIYHMNYVALCRDLMTYHRNSVRVIMCCGDEYTARSIMASLREEEVGVNYTDTVDEDYSGVCVTPFKISYGFNYSRNKLVVIGTDELVKKRETKKSAARKRQAFTVPKCGDYVVHDVHGIGLCMGITRLQLNDTEKDYVLIQYRDSDRLYVPIDQMDTISRYSGSDRAPTLSRLGGKDFAKLKERVKASVKEMAFDLLELYSKRRKVKGFKYSEDTVWQKEFEDSFEFTETEDQLEAVREIKRDMESGTVMDRLLCGDVGYGKTEVALRAVFKTVMDGKQAAILAPTTILARQHYNTAMTRFNEFKLKCVLLSRFQSKKETESALKQIKSGEASVIVATHRLLSSDVEFNDLGLLVLDEEQRFGVEHKEKIKLIQNNVNILTLSATPIPRTLNMALTGVRDISTLETPPQDRLPVQTYVTELTDALLKDCIERELARGGQVFILFNRVQGIESFAARVRELVPDGRVVIGHGQMDDSALEENINKFYNKEANILVSTTIIENGIDLPDANTLIVCDADRLGLSALYQLRGRVGRSSRIAYAYFTTKPNKVLTEDATKRLNAIMEYTDFGSGFKIAMRDLEIRGAGNILGKEQHGHIEKVGYDMYCKLLQEAVDELSGEKSEEGASVEITAEIDAYLDDNYVSDTNEKIKIYKEISEVRDEESRQSLITRLKENFGEPPATVINLIDIGFIKNMAKKINADKVTVTSKGAGIEFADGSCFKDRNVMFAVSDMSKECILTPTDRPTIIFDCQNDVNVKKMKKVIKFLKKSNGIF